LGGGVIRRWRVENGRTNKDTSRDVIEIGKGLMNIVDHSDGEGTTRTVTADVVTKILATMPVNFETVLGAKNSDEIVDKGGVFPGVFDEEVINPEHKLDIFLPVFE
jgi:hypothetical protein